MPQDDDPKAPGTWTDLTLAGRCAARDEAAWEELLRRIGPSALHVMARVFRRAGLPDPEAEAGEALGSLASALLDHGARALRAYRPPIPLRIYLGVIARNVACRALRKHRPALPLDAVDAEDLSWVPVEKPLDAERLRQAMEGLAPRDRLLLQLVYWKGLGYAEAAQVLGVAPGTIGPLLTQAREALRRLAPLA